MRARMIIVSGLLVLLASASATAQDAPPPPGPPPSEQPPPPPEPAPAQPPPPATQPPPPPYVPPADPRDRMDGAVDLGLGLFEFIHLDISWLISREWVVGLGLGMFPIDWLLRKAMGVEGDELSGELDIYGFQMAGNIDTKLGAGSIFGRWFPTRKKKLFLEAVLGVWRLDATATGTLDHAQLPEQLEVEVNAKVWVPMVGVHLGWRFLFKKGPFIDLGGGANVMLTPGAEVTFGGATVDDIRDYPAAADALDMVQSVLSDKLADGVEQVAQKRNRIFPTAYLRFGWAFDLW